MGKSNHFIDSKIQEWKDLGSGIKRCIMGFDKSIMMVKASFEKGAVGKLHKHSHSQVTYVISGRFEVEIDREKRILKEGEGFYVPPEKMHGAVCLEKGILIDVFSPFRNDFLTTKQ